MGLLHPQIYFFDAVAEIRPKRRAGCLCLQLGILLARSRRAGVDCFQFCLVIRANLLLALNFVFKFGDTPLRFCANCFAGHVIERGFQRSDVIVFERGEGFAIRVASALHPARDLSQSVLDGRLDCRASRLASQILNSNRLQRRGKFFQFGRVSIANFSGMLFFHFDLMPLAVLLL
ncbi:MAG: hypothetical protein DLM68_01780 [Hyphomicrobiales bacterium]|nr:MAG: hypothetical protein DLM68_01780 [Hyphomicrobiales bacterium]